MKIIFSILFFCVGMGTTFSQKTENLIIVTYDGLRWQEVFGGVDSALMNSKDFNKYRDQMKAAFWKETATERRETLFPFFWNTVAKQGQLHGNIALGSKVNNANPQC